MRLSGCFLARVFLLPRPKKRTKRRGPSPPPFPCFLYLTRVFPTSQGPLFPCHRISFTAYHPRQRVLEPVPFQIVWFCSNPLKLAAEFVFLPGHNVSSIQRCVLPKGAINVLLSLWGPRNGPSGKPIFKTPCKSPLGAILCKFGADHDHLLTTKALTLELILISQLLEIDADLRKPRIQSPLVLSIPKSAPTMCTEPIQGSCLD